MKVLSINSTDYSIPSTWNELSKEQLLEMCHVILLPLDEKYKRLMMLGYFTNLSFKFLRTLPEETLPEILSIFDFLFKESRLTINHFAKLGNMVGPEPGLTNFTFEQFFGESEAYYYLVCTQASDDDLNNLINCMYNYRGSAENTNIIKKLSNQDKLAIFFFYQGSSAFIKHKFKDVFKSGSDKTKPDGLEFTRLVNKINQGDLSKNEAIKKSNLYEALTYLQNLIIDGIK